MPSKIKWYFLHVFTTLDGSYVILRHWKWEGCIADSSIKDIEIRGCHGKPHCPSPWHGHGFPLKRKIPCSVYFLNYTSPQTFRPLWIFFLSCKISEYIFSASMKPSDVFQENNRPSTLFRVALCNASIPLLWISKTYIPRLLHISLACPCANTSIPRLWMHITSLPRVSQRKTSLAMVLVGTLLSFDFNLLLPVSLRYKCVIPNINLNYLSFT
jgi:hypothetical protein